MAHTFLELSTLYLEQCLRSKASYPFYQRLTKQYFLDWPDQPTKATIRSWHLAHARTPSHANKGLGYLKAMYNWAINEGFWLEDSPAAGIRRHPTQSRDRVMTKRELALLVDALDFMQGKLSRFLTMLLTTGCRMGEALRMRWEDVDLEMGVWVKPTTKNGTSQRMPLPSQAVAAIRAMPKGGPYVFMGLYQHCWSRTAAEKAWGKFRPILRLEGVRLHDFRRTLASRLYEQERDLLLVKACLNHSDGSPTAVYVRLQFDRLAGALQAHADALWTLAKGGRHEDTLQSRAGVESRGLCPVAPS